MATHRIILKKKKGLIGAEYIDVIAACAVVPDQLAKLTREKRKERADDGYSEAYFDKDLNIVFVKVKAGTKGSITLTLTAAYHFNEWEFLLLVPTLKKHLVLRGRKWPYSCDSKGQLAFGVRELLMEGAFDNFDVVLDNVEQFPNPEGTSPFVTIHPYAKISGKEKETISVDLKRPPITIDVPIPGTGEAAKFVKTGALIAHLEVWNDKKPVPPITLPLAIRVEFEKENQADMSNAQFARLQTWARTIKNNETLYAALVKQRVTFYFKGHASKTGAELKNHDLSRDRARNVKKRLEGLLPALRFGDPQEAAGEEGALQTDVPKGERDKAYLRDRWAVASASVSLDGTELAKTEKVRKELAAI